MTDQESRCDHLFISYAWEDAALAEWLTRKLTAAGFFVWCDRFKLLGGESYPKDIDAAIKTKTFRVIALLSRHSADKDNPVKERTLALNIGKARKIDFLIPLNVDGLSPAELPWMTSDLTFIPFRPSWAIGLQQLLKKLDSIAAPRLRENGSQVAVETFLPSDVLKNAPEALFSNCLRFRTIPVAINRFKLDRKLEIKEYESLAFRWAFWKVDPTTVLAFHAPPSLDTKMKIKQSGVVSWMDSRLVDGIPTSNVVSSLLYKSLSVKCVSKGLHWTPDHRFFFPQGLLEKDTAYFTGYDGGKSRVLVTSERKAWSPGKSPSMYRYHLSPEFSVVRNFHDPFIAQVRIRLHLTDATGQPLPQRSAVARRKKICKSWWNHEWLNRVLAICHFLADGNETIVIGEQKGQQVVLDARPIQFDAPMGINEEVLSKVDDKPSEQEVDDLDGEEESEQAGDSNA